MALKDNLKQLGDRLKLNSHYGIERFGIFFTVLAVLAGILTVSAGISSYQNSRGEIGTTASYVTKTSTSRTQLPVSVEGVYISPERTRAMVMMKFQDATKISTEASKYQAFLTGATVGMQDERLKNPVSGKVVVFGSSGYMGVVLDSPEPFPMQILNLTVRANSELVYAAGDPKLRKDLQGQASFQENDQWRVYVNPGASEAVEASSLSGQALDAQAVFYQLVISPQEQKVRDQLDDQLGVLRADLARMKEYEDALGRTPTLDGDFLVNPRVPSAQPALVSIASDEVTGEPSPAGSDEESTLALDTDWTAPQGFDFDWRSGSVKEGYLDNIVPAGQRYGEWLTAKAQSARQTEAGDGATANFSATKIDWTLTSGTKLADKEATQAAGIADVLALRDNLAKAYGDYAKAKQDYQVKLLGELVQLEVDLRGTAQSTSVNEADQALHVY